MASGSRAVVRRRDDADSFPLALTHFRRGMDRLFDDMLSFPLGGSLLGSDLTAPIRDLGLPRSLAIDVAELPDRFDFHVECPGCTKEDVGVEVDDDNVMTVTVERRHSRDIRRGPRGSAGGAGGGAEGGSESAEDDGVTWHRVERSYGKVSRSVQLPANGDGSAVTARMENGILSIAVPKKEVKEGKKKVAIE